MAKKNRISPIFKEAFNLLFRKSATGQYPFVKCEPAEGFRGKQIFDTDLCIGCGLCSKDCPAKAIEMIEVGGKKRPEFFLDRCIFCYQCADSCPRDAIKSTAIFELATTDKSSLKIEPHIPKPTQPAAKAQTTPQSSSISHQSETINQAGASQ
ncbi:MAG: NADH-quinone oxidoreductase subunit I [Crenarchaeota archaeon]|nr:NADH-quinone oxidoreductase subunit I [Thermoproteota archaeon]